MSRVADRGAGTGRGRPPMGSARPARDSRCARHGVRIAGPSVAPFRPERACVDAAWRRRLVRAGAMTGPRRCGPLLRVVRSGRDLGLSGDARLQGRTRRPPARDRRPPHSCICGKAVAPPVAIKFHARRQLPPRCRYSSIPMASEPSTAPMWRAALVQAGATLVRECVVSACAARRRRGRGRAASPGGD
jgi:hypothetical protein